LRLGLTDRQRLQIALTSLGLDTRGTDGVFGPRSREMIAGWQQKVGAPATGFVTAAQRDQLFRSAAPAIARWDEEQKKFEEQKRLDNEKKRADDAKAAAPPPAAAPVPAAIAPPAQVAPAPAAAASPAGAYDGIYNGALYGGGYVAPLRVQVVNGSGSGTIDARSCGLSSLSVTISSTGDVSGKGEGFRAASCGVHSVLRSPFTIKGRAEGIRLELVLSGDLSIARVSLARSGN
jgi:hypothetical protein